MARDGSGGLGTARGGSGWLGLTQDWMARDSSALLGMARDGSGWLGMALDGSGWLEMALDGSGWLGMAGGVDCSNLQSLFPKTNALSIKPQDLLLPCCAIRMFSMGAIRLHLQRARVGIFKIPAAC